MEKNITLNGRYTLTSVERRGGMSIVSKGIDLQTGDSVAVKSWIGSHDLQRARESLMREAKALTKLQHRNIVKLIEFVRHDDGRDYLVLEWLQGTLHDHIREHGALSWNDFYARFGRPILEAVAYAHRQQWTHRDISPRNILIDGEGAPRLIDYGIGKQTKAGDEWNPISGKTFLDARTRGFSPPETPVGIDAYRRDCFSFAAVACYSVSGVEILDDDDLRVAFDAAEFPGGIRDIVDRAISHNPDARFPMGGALLEQIDSAEQARWLASRSKYQFRVSPIDSVRQRLGLFIGDRGSSDVDDFLKRELNEDPFCLLSEVQASQNRVESIASFEIYSPEWRFRCAVAGIDRNRLEIVDVVKIGQSATQKLRDEYIPISVKFIAMSTALHKEDSQALAEFLGELLTETRERLARAEEQRIHSLLGAWRSLVREQAALAAAREWAVSYVSRTIAGDRTTFECDESLTNEILDQRRYIRRGKATVFGQIVSVSDRSLVLEILRGDPKTIPPSGVLEIDTNAAERAASTQIRAIDRVQYGDTANPQLAELLVNPKDAISPTTEHLEWDNDDPLHPSLRKIVEASMGIEDVYVVEGPPGTGKTSLIANVIQRFLERSPDASILLASQTHIAVDNVLEKLIPKLGMEVMIRIGQKEDQRIHAKSQEMLLSHRVEAWATQVHGRAQDELKAWASSHGIDPRDVEAGIYIERILRCREQYGELTDQESRLAGSVSDDEQGRSESSERGLQSAEVAIDTDAALTDARHTIRQIERAEREARARLRRLGGDASELAHCNDDAELADWSRMYLPSDSNTEQCRKRIELLEGWFQRLGRGQDFYIPMMAEASVIASTCVAIGGVRGIEEVQFDLCIVDESSKATAPEALIPMALSKKWLLVGDPRQLPPFFDRSGSEEAATDLDDEARRTILDRFLDPVSGLGANNRRRLELQFRMIRPIGDLISKVFYDGWLKSANETHGWSIVPAIPAPVSWYSTTALENRFQQRYGAHSWQNRLEAKIVKDILDNLQAIATRGKRNITVAVIAGYIGQVRLLEDICKRHVSDWSRLSVVCNSVDAFQGREADVCVYSVTRSNRTGRLGFLREKPRLNVALSRGQTGLIIVGDHVFCRNARGENPFEPVISYIEANTNDCAVVTQW